jgi:hypothetical protein
MDIDDLSKSQLLLLTLLVNFVMSIATGIVTVSLLDQAPQTVTQTVNRIVEHTVETVVPAATPADDSPAPVQQPTEEDLLVAAIKGDAARTVYLYADSTTTPPVAQGIYLPKSRAVLVIADGSIPENAVAGFPDGTSAQVSLSKSDDSLMIYGFGDATSLPSAPATSLLDPSVLQQGQAVIALMADGSAVTGIISKVDGSTITTTLPQTPAGAAAVTLTGGLVGISTGAGSAYVSAADASTLLSSPSTP